MDPVSELSTLAASYLWALRDAFPRVKQVRDLALVLSNSIYFQPTGSSDSFDFAVWTRFYDIAHRQDQECWSRSDADFHDDTESPSRDRWDHSHHDNRYRDLLWKFRDTDYRVWPEKLTEHLTDKEFIPPSESLDAFRKHARYLIRIFGHLPLQHDTAGPMRAAMTRERLADHINRQLLHDVALRTNLATFLDYVPVLLRGFRTTPDVWLEEGLDATWRTLISDENYPSKLVAFCKRAGLALPFALVLDAELDEIDRVRRQRNPAACTNRSGIANVDSTRRQPIFQRAFDSNLLAIAFSGGGIRSATFNLGVLQGLANTGWLPKIDYLSMVSGGGYIGAWLIAWTKRTGSIAAVQESLCGHVLPGPVPAQSQVVPPTRTIDPSAEHVRPIRLLREFSNYLTPQAGGFSTDSWTMVSIWVRNTLLNLLVLTLFLMAVLLLPRLLGFVYLNADLPRCLAATIGCLLCAAVFSGRNLRTFMGPSVSSQQRGDTPFVVIISIVVPLMLAAVFAAQAMWFARYEAATDRAVFVTSFLTIFGCLGLASLWSYNPRSHRQRYSMAFEVVDVGLALARNLAASASAALAAATAVMALYRLTMPVLLEETRRGIWLDLAFGPLAMLAIIGLAITIYLGIEGVHLPDERREWWSRLGAWLGLMGIGWMIVATISYFSPYGAATLAGLEAGTLGIGWSLLTATGAWMAQSGKSNGVNLAFDRNLITSALIKASPFLFIAGFLVVLAIQTHVLMLFLPRMLNSSEMHTVLAPLPFAVERYTGIYWAFMDPNPWWPAVIAASLFGLAFVVAWRVDVNEFSMHHFYKNRLVRTYLGASRSRAQRRPNAFTGLDMQDDVKLWRFQSADASMPQDGWTNCRAGYYGPFPIINATLNMTVGDELAWQERKGQSFVFTPLYCGYDFASKQTIVSETLASQFGFRPTKQFAGGPEDEEPNRRSDVVRKDGGTADDVDWRSGRDRVIAEARKAWAGDDCGIGLGTAIAISGAAANPNAGYHSSPGVAFLLTVLNARLGWWIGNPRFETWRKSSPSSGLFYLLSELFGFSGVDRKFVQLSDGGHFDNTGLYELIRRRCRFIILCDAEQDDHYALNGLAAAVRKCRVDFGVIIDLPTDAIRKRKGGFSAAHTAVGTVTYPDQPVCGHIVYIKASLTGDEPIDVLEYRSRHVEFPHQTTGDQFFDESQFESYRALGQHIVDGTFPNWGGYPEPPEAYHSRLKSLITSVSPDGK